MSAADWGRTGTQRWSAMTAVIADAVTAVDETVAVGVLEVILHAHARGPTGRCRLAEELRDHGERLTHDDPRTSPLLARVIADLVAAGHHVFVQPTCPSCGRPRIYAYPTENGARVCRGCRPPRKELCSGCGELRRVARRAADGSATCSTCRSHDASIFETCVLCERDRRVAMRDSLGRPFCHPCYKAQRPDRTGRWIGNREQRRQARQAAVLEVAAAALPGTDPAVVTTCLDQAGTTSNGHAVIANWLIEHPHALTDGDNTCPPAVLTFIDLLIAAGAGAVRPACASCGRTDRPLPHTAIAGRICPSCYLRANAEPCTRCGQTAPVHGRTAEGDPICQACTTKRRPPIECSRCGRIRPLGGRFNGEALCTACRRRVVELFEECSQCGKARPVGKRLSDGRALCPSCGHQRRTASCTECHRVRTVSARIDGQPYCRDCRPRKPRDCPRCGHHRVCRRVVVPEDQRVYGQEITQILCGPCLARQRLEAMLRVGEEPAAAHWQPLIESMLASPDTDTLLEWIQTRTAATVLRELAHHHGPPSHADLDRMSLKNRHSVEQVRALLEAAGLLDRQDPRRHRLAHRLEARIENDCPAADRLVVRAYVQWSFLPALERSARRAKRPIYANRASDVGAVIAYLRHVHAKGLSLQGPHQGAFDEWIASHRSHLGPLREFLRWAQRHGHSSRILIPQRPRKAAIEFITDDQRRAAITSALTEPGPGWSDADRLAVLLVLLYGQGPTRIVSLTSEDISIAPDGTVHLRLGRDPVQLIEPVAALALRLRGRTLPTAALREVPSPWLYPGHSPGRHLHPTTLSLRLKALGVPSRAGHNSTLLDLARHAAPAVLADLLGLHPSTVEVWSNAAGTRWASYATLQQRSRP